MNTFLITVEKFEGEYSQPTILGEFAVITEMGLDEALLALAPKHGINATKVEGFSGRRWAGNIYGVSIHGHKIKTFKLDK